MKLIPRSKIQPVLPVTPTITWYLFLKYITAPGWVWGVIGTFITIRWLCDLYILATSELEK